MDWPIAEVARLSGVTARTLRHYDEIGLLPPARIGTNGHRRYEERQLLLLQQILVLGELGVGLPEISRILAEQVDEVEALRGHHRRLVAERDRLDALAATVFRAIGRSCVDNEQWRGAYEAIAPGLAAYQRDAIEAYAAARLG
ncbi:MerR family transcriptional regulator [Streptomyces cyaneofuscatus]|uniref:MerR family transcriptional regulator n=1 Tax=Streptomyces cyaneofuscatus TaxID=66883 RepID=UPI003667FE25